MRHQHAQWESDVVIQKRHRPGEDEKDQWEAKKHDCSPTQLKPHRSDDHALKSKESDVVGAHSVAYPEKSKRQNYENHPKPGGCGCWERFLVYCVNKKQECTRQHHKAMPPIPAALRDVDKLLKGRLIEFSITLRVRYQCKE